MIYIYRKVKAHRQKKAKLAQSGEPSALVSPDTDQEKAEKKAIEKARWRSVAIIAVALFFPVFLETLDYTIVATAQPHIASAFNRLDLQSYIGTVYLLTSAVFLPLFASISDVYGRYIAMQLSIAFFLVGSVICTAAQNMPMMLAGRGISGVGAAGLLTVVRVIISDSTSLNDNNIQVSLIVLLYAVAFSSGPAIGGALTSVSFRWVFAINLPCCVLAMIIDFFLLRNRVKGPIPLKYNGDETPGSSQPSELDRILRLDWIGATLFVVGFILILLGLNWGSNDGWHSARVIVSLAIGGILVVKCVAWEYILEKKQESSNTPGRLFAADPMIPLPILTNFDVVATEFAAFTSGMVMLVVFYFISIFMVVVIGLSPTKAGVQLIYFAPGMGGGNWIAITLIKIFRQPKYPIILGGTIIPIGLGLVSMAINSNHQSQVNGFMAMTGVGVGMTFGPLAIHARFSQPNSRVAIVTAMNLFFRSLGGTIGLAQCATVMSSKLRTFLTHAAANSPADFDLPQVSLATLSSLQDIDNLPPQIQAVVREGFRIGLRWSFISLIPWCGVSLILCLFLSKIKDTDRPRVDENTNENEKPEKPV